tara:strand:+ start:8297 stop:9250 length:954 start_codon:yes stop_codon:yes gene_type:complete
VTGYPRVEGPDPQRDPLLGELLQHLRVRHHDAACAALVYGSCLRSGDIYDGLLDLYLICDSYRSAYRRWLPAAANWLLPPNVFYAEQTGRDAAGAERTLRAKVTLISLRDFRRGCSRSWFESYIWGRFAQPTHVLYARDAEVRTDIEQALLNAAHTLLRRAIPALPQTGTLDTLWEQALALSYSTELRTERSGRAAELARDAHDFYAAVTRLHAPAIGHGFRLRESASGITYSSAPSGPSRTLASMGWALRRAQGKLLSILRLVKGLFTFEGGLDYIAWKLERHSGESIEIPDKVRRAPLIHLWAFFWGLYKRGIFK